MVTSNAQRSIVEWSARRGAHHLRAKGVRLRYLKTKAHRRFRRHVSRQLHAITCGVMESDALDVCPGKRRLTSWEVT